MWALASPSRQVKLHSARWLEGVRPLALVLAGGTLLRVVGLGDQSLWYDEWLTAYEAGSPFIPLLWQVTHLEITPPLFFACAWLAAHLFGDSEIVLRSVSALAGIALVPIGFAIGSTLAGRRAGLIAALLVSTNPFLIWYSQEARSYSLLAALSAGSFLAFVKLDREFSWKWLWLWVASSCLAAITHFFAGYLIAPETAYLVWRHRSRPAVWLAAAIVLLGQVAVVPLAVLRHSEGTAWIARISLDDRLAELPVQFLTGFARLPTALVLTVLVGSTALAVVGLARAGRGPERHGSFLAGAIALVAIGTPLLLLLAGQDYFVSRNLIIALVPALAAFSCAVVVSRIRAAGLAAVGLLCATGMAAVIQVDARSDLQRPAWRALAQALGQGRERAILAPGGYRALPLQRYLAHARIVLAGSVSIRELDVVGARPRLGPEACWWGSACNTSYLKLSASPPAPGFRLVAKRRVGMFEVARWVAHRPVAVSRSAAKFVYGRRSGDLHEKVLFLQQR